MLEIFECFDFADHVSHGRHDKICEDFHTHPVWDWIKNLLDGIVITGTPNPSGGSSDYGDGFSGPFVAGVGPYTGPTIGSGGGSGGGYVNFCTQATSLILIDEMALMNHLIEFENRTGISEVNGSPLFTLISPSCANSMSSYEEFESCMISSIGCHYGIDPDEWGPMFSECSGEVNFDECIDMMILESYWNDFIEETGVIWDDDFKSSILSPMPSASTISYAEFLDLATDHWVNFVLSSSLEDDIDNDEFQIRLVKCETFNWALFGDGFVTCLDPVTFTVKVGGVGTSELDFGCYNFTVPHNRRDANGVIYQTNTEGEAASCASFAMNAVTIKIKASMLFFPVGNRLQPLAQTVYRKVFLQGFKEFIDDSSCGYGAIATCSMTGNDCPHYDEPILTDDLVTVTIESLLGDCH